MRHLSAGVVATLLAVSGLYAQHVVSVRAGLIHYVEGDVKLDGEKVQIRKNGQFPQMKNASVLSTAEGRAEILLAPGVFLRLAEGSTLAMLNDDLTDTRLELREGSALIEAAEIEKGNQITARVGEATATISRQGLYQLDAAAGEIRVYDGKLQVVSGDATLTLKKGRLLALNGEGQIEKFNTKEGDALYRWSARRSGYIAMANLSGARSLYRSGLSFARGQWLWNPYFGMMTFVPASGLAFSPFGYGFYAPGAVISVYRPRPVMSPGMNSGFSRYDSSLGYSVRGGRSYGGFSSGGGGAAVSSAPSGGGAVASPRSSDAAVGRSGGGGGRGR
jgi:hypothetical protein